MHGESITLTATVSSIVSPGTPTGTVTFLNGSTSIGTGTLNASGVATITTLFPVGTYALTANYAGDGTYNASSSAPPTVTQNVNPASTTTAVNSSANPSVFGSSVTFTATIAVVAPGTTTGGAPTGTVTFFDGSTNIGSGTVSGTTATFTTSSLATGSHTISASYGGDANYSSSTSSNLSQTVNQGTTTSTVASSQLSSPFGSPVTFTATISVATGTGTPTGPVTFKDGATTIGTGTLSGSAPYTASSGAISNLSVGSHSITAVYAGDINFSTSTSPTITEVITQGTTTTSLTSSVNPSTYGQSITLTANVAVATGAGTPTGTVTFKDGSTTLGSGSVTAGVATFTINNLSVATHSLTAVYTGDTNFSTSTSSPAVSQVVNKATPIDTLTTSGTPSNFGSSVTFTAVISSPTTLGLPTGTVTFMDGATILGTPVTLTATSANSATASYTTMALSGGTHTITAQYSGDGNFNSVTSNSVSQVVTPVTSTTTSIFSNSPNASEIGQAVTFQATVVGNISSPPAAPSGTITFFNNGTQIGSQTVTPVTGNPNSSTAAITTSALTLGAHSITAQYNGDASYPASPVSSTFTQNVIQANTTTTIVTTPSTTTVYSQNVTYNITVSTTSPGMGAPSGTVSFYDEGTPIGTSTPLVAGTNQSTAIFSTTSLGLGIHKIEAVYTGDTNFTNSPAKTITQTINMANTTTTITSSSSSPAGFNFGDYITFNVTVAPASPATATPTGNVQFYDNGVLISNSSVTLINGMASFTTLILTPGTHAITAMYQGSTYFITSTSAPFSQTITGNLPTITTIVSSRNPAPTGTAAPEVFFTAQVQAQPGTGQGSPGNPTGTVTFYDSTTSTTIAANVPLVNGVATSPNYPISTVGAHTISATYNNADGFYTTSNASLTQYYVANNTTTTLTISPNPATQGGTTTLTATVTGGVPNGNGNVTFYDGANVLGTAPVIGGVATLNVTDLTFGSHSITAAFTSTNISTTTYASSTTATPTTLVIQQTGMITTSTTLTSSLAASYLCESVTFTATVANTEPGAFYNPTGSVTFFSDGVEIGTSILSESSATTSVATLTIATLPLGTHSITATYNSDSNYAFSFSNTIQQTVSPNITATSFTIIPTGNTPYGNNLIMIATVTTTSTNASGGAVIPTGTVTFAYPNAAAQTVVIGSADVDTEGKAILEISTLNAGTYTITATYVADPCCGCNFVTSNATLVHTIVPIAPAPTLTVSPNPSTYGTMLTLNARVTSSVGTPTGSVTFTSTQNGTITQLGTIYLTMEGSAYIEVPSPLAGIAVIGAAYSGDNNYLAINAQSVLQTINKAPTSTCLVTYTTNPSVYGESVALHAIISSVEYGENPSLTGTVTFTNGSTTLGTVTLTGCNTADLQVSNLLLGSGNNIIATYSGDSNYATSASGTLNQTVVQSATTTTFTAAPTTAAYKATATYAVTVAPTFPGAGVPTGTITGYYGSQVIGPVTLVNGTATLTTNSTNPLPVGVQTLIVKYNGDTNFTTSQGTTTVTVTPTSSSTTVASSVNPSVSGQPVVLTATVTSTAGTPTGTVSFLDGTTTLATETLNSSGVATFTTSNLNVATHTITVMYSGSTNIASSTSSALSQVVNKGTIVTTLTSSLDPSYYGQNFLLTANISAASPATGIPTGGTVTFKNGAATLGTATLLNGQASLSISTALAASVTPYSLTASYGGDSNFNASTTGTTIGTLSQTINKAPSYITATYSPNPLNFGSNLTLNVTVAPLNTASGIPTGTVTVSFGSQVLSGTLNSSGVVTPAFSIPNLPAGTDGLVVQYTGDTNFLQSTIPITETVNFANSTTTLTSVTNPTIFGQPATFTVAVRSPAESQGVPFGVVTFMDGTKIIGTQALDSSGNSTFTTSALGVGSHSITAVYGGDTTNNGSTSNVITQVVNQAATLTTVTSNLNPALYGENITLKAIVSSATAGSGIPTGTIQFLSDGVTIPTGGTVALNSLGEAYLTVSSLAVGSHAITAVYSADSNFATSTSPTLTQVITSTPTITGVTSNLNPSTFGTAVPITVTVAALNNGSTIQPSDATPVTAYYGSTIVGSGTISGGAYNFSLTGLPAGTLAIEVKYPGNGNFNASSVTLTQTVTAAASSITITSISPNPSTYGQSVTINNTVLPAGTTTGTVSYYDGTTLIGTSAPNQPLVISTLATGSHSITAVYSGTSGVNPSAPSAAVILTVQKDPTTTSISSNLNPSTFGAPVSFSATVAATTPGGGIPTGTVTFSDNGTALTGGVVALNSSGVATFTTSTLPAGANSITVTYSGDNNFNNSNSSLTQTVNQDATTTTLVSNLNPSNYGSSVKFTATVSPTLAGAGTPTGTVTFENNGVALLGGTVALNSNGVATFSTSTLPVGTLPITAVYNGTSSLGGSTSNTVNQIVGQTNAGILLTSNIDPSLYGEAVMLIATVYDSADPFSLTPTGTVTFKYGTTTLGTATLSGTGVATLSTTTLPVGVNEIIATYNGDANFATVQSAQLAQVVQTTPTIISAISSLNPSPYGTNIAVSGTITALNNGSTVIPPDNSVVTAYVGATTVGTGVTTNGHYSFNLSGLPAGTLGIEVKYPGDSNFNSASITLNQTVTADTSSIIIASSINPSVFGQPVTFTNSVSLTPSGQTATGTVTYYDGTTVIGTVPANQPFTTSTLATGLNAITAIYTGANATTSAPSNTINQTVNKDATTTTLISSLNPSTFGSSVTFTATVTANAPGSGFPTGSVTFSNGGVPLQGGDVAINNNGVAVLTIANLPVGGNAITAVYSGNNNFNTSTGQLTQVVNQDTSSVALVGSTSPSNYGEPVTFTATITAPGGAPLTGNVTFENNGVALANGVMALDSNGAATITTSLLPVGSNNITAVYSGSSNITGSSSPVLVHVIAQNSSSISLTTNLDPSLYGESVTLTAAVIANNSGMGVPTGTVTFLNGADVIATQPLASNGVATVATTALPVGSDAITATYSGDTNFATATSNPVNQVVQKTPTIISVASALNPSNYGTPVSISGNVLALNNGSPIIPPNATITAYVGATAVGSGTMTNGFYNFTLTGLPAGILPIEVKYVGNGNFDSSTITLNQTVLADNSTISVNATPPNSSTYNEAVTFNDIVTLPSGTTPTGTVTYYDGTTAIGTVQVNHPLTVTNLTPGPHTITAVYSGSPNATAVTSSIVNYTVTPSNNSIAVTSSINPSVYGNNVTFTATITTPNGGIPTGFVTFSNGNTILGMGELDSTGQATFSTNGLPAGTNSITGVYSGDANYSTSTSPVLSQVVTRVAAANVATTIILTTPNPSVFGQNVSFFANVTSAAGVPTGTVTFYDGATLLGTSPLYDGFAVYSIASLSTGGHLLTAVYNGDSNYNASLTSPTYLQTVLPISITATTVTTLTSSLNPSTFGDPVTFTAHISSAEIPPPYPTGYVTFYSGSDPLITLPINPTTGDASYTTSTLPAGTLQIVALYSGDNNYSASTNTLSQVVIPIATQMTLSSSLNPSQYGDAVAFTAVVTASEGIPTGSVSFYDGGNLLGTSLLSNGGTATYVTSILTTGSHLIEAFYNQDPSFATSSSSLIQVVNMSGTVTTVVTSSPNPSNLGDSVSFIASTTSPNGTPSGLVTFYNNGVQMGSSTLFGGLAIFSTSSLTTGLHNITASYAGSVNFAPSTSGIYVQQVINGLLILQPPRSFCGYQRVDKQLNKKDYVNVLKWQPAGVGAEPTFYRIYRNAQLTDLAAEISTCSCCYQFNDCKRKKGVSYTYYLVAANASTVSSAVSITVGPQSKKGFTMGDLVTEKEDLSTWHLHSDTQD